MKEKKQKKQKKQKILINQILINEYPLIMYYLFNN